MSAERDYVLGLDLGSASIGWALIDENLESGGAIIRAGVHRFDAGVEGDFESGREESRAKQRRDARQPRRQHWRRAWRRGKVLRLLQRNGLLPEGRVDSPQAIHEYMLDVDRKMRADGRLNGDRIAQHLVPYLLRKRALDERLEPIELGRALYHLAQRRGFWSNRKTNAAEDQEGEVKESIGVLRDEMARAGARTLGEFFAGLDPEEERVRRRWTAREMFTEEFDAIWDAQREHDPELLSEDFRSALYEAMFFQRPLKSQRHLLGKCDLIPTEHRAPLGLLVAQSFRLLQKANDLAIVAPRGASLSAEQKRTVAEALERDGDQTFPKLRKLLKLRKETEFNLQAGGDKRVPGNRTNQKLAAVFGERWWSMAESEREQVVDDVLTYEKEAALVRRGMERWGLERDAARELAAVQLEQDTTRHGRTALGRLVERMRDGTSYGTARKEVFPGRFETRPALAELPAVKEALEDVTSPAVLRALTELRKVVNAIIREYGKPAMIRIELARDLKRPRKQREEMSKQNRDNERSRAQAKLRILKELGAAHPSRQDVEKVLLAEECDWRCPFTSKPICMQTLLGANPQFDVEHIWPFSRSLDNGYMNKTLCYHEENRARKRNNTPWEAYGHNDEKWNEIVGNVQRFKGNAARAKLRRFTATEIPEDLATRELNETRYVSRMALQYLGALYGGTSDEEHRQRVQVNTGRATAHLRNEWGLNAILGDGGMKSRDDHRHHAVDAIAIALCGPAIVQRLARAAETATEHNRRLFAPVRVPWDGFIDDVRRIVLGDPAEPLSGILVSKRPNRKLNGVLHAETMYSKPIRSRNGEQRHVRKALHKLSATELKGDAIVDPVIRKLVKDKYAELGGAKPEKAFAEPGNHPVVTTKSGRQIPIHKVRVKANVKPWAVGAGARQRWVTGTGGSNHHVVIVAVLDRSGRESKWEAHVVSRFEVMTRLRKGSPIVQREWGEGRAFKFSLMQGDYVVMDSNLGVPEVLIVTGMSEKPRIDIEFRTHDDARKREAIWAAKDRKRASVAKLHARNARKVQVTRLGELRDAGG